MAGILGMAPLDSLYGAPNALLSSDLDTLIDQVWAPLPIAAAAGFEASRQTYTQRAGDRWQRHGATAHHFTLDYYDRVHVIPRELPLGAVVSAQVRDVVVWNAFQSTGRAVVQIDAAPADAGVDLQPPGALPFTLQPNEEQVWSLTADGIGVPTIDVAFVITFGGYPSLTMRVTGTRLVAWTVPADWARPVQETLAWMTDVQRPLGGGSVRTPLRAGPRRTWEFEFIADRIERRTLEAAIYDWSASPWALPVWTDVVLLGMALPAGSGSVAVATEGRDFYVGGLVMLLADARRYELAEVAAISAGSLTLQRPTLQAWGAGTRVYPVRSARMLEAPVMRRLNDQVSSGRVRFDADEPCDWPAEAPATTYLGYPVLELRPDESNDPTFTASRRITVIDGEVGLVSVDDFSGLVSARQTHDWLIFGRAEHTVWRSLLYWLEGRAQAFWLPTWTDDLTLTETVDATAVTLRVEACGVAANLRQQRGRQHLRIELLSGVVLYRRVLASTDLHDGTEQLSLSAALGVDIAPADVRMICWLALAYLDTDRIEIGHETDVEGVSMCRLAFETDGGDEP